MVKRLGLATFLVLWGCATTPEDPNIPSVPVYSEEEAPCEYEVVDRIRVRQPSGAPSFDEFRRRLLVALGQAGARAGADAVIAEIPREGAGVARRREVGRSNLPPPPPGFPGLAVRFVPGTCGD
jgi:hypothetical protein